MRDPEAAVAPLPTIDVPARAGHVVVDAFVLEPLDRDEVRLTRRAVAVDNGELAAEEVVGHLPFRRKAVRILRVDESREVPAAAAEAEAVVVERIRVIDGANQLLVPPIDSTAVASHSVADLLLCK
jgi:hypothetical protein